MQVASLNNSAFLLLWESVKGCQGITGCDDAKEKFTTYADSKITALALEAAAIVGQSQQ